MAKGLNRGDTRTPLSRLLASMSVSEIGSRADIPADMLQGRAAGHAGYFCGDLPPLRSAVFSFIGPAGSAVEVAPSVARRGKSTATWMFDVLQAEPQN